MKILYKKLHTHTTVPHRATEWAAGYDVTATEMKIDPDSNTVIYCTGLSVELPKTTFLDLRSQSRICKTEWMLANGAGVIDADYRGKIKLVYRPINAAIDVRDEQPFKIGDCVGQLILCKYFIQDYEDNNELSTTVRDVGGFGSTK
jgi:dUTP pyrophosphatase